MAASSPLGQWDLLVFHAKTEPFPETNCCILGQINPTAAAVNLVKVLEKVVRIGPEGRKRAPIVHRLAIGPTTDINALTDAIKRSTIVFVPITMAFGDDSQDRPNNKPMKMLQTVLQETFSNAEKSDCLIPLFYVSKADSGGFVMPVYLQSLRGISLASLFTNKQRLDQIDPDLIDNEHIDTFTMDKISKRLESGRNAIYKRETQERDAWEATPKAVPVSVEGEGLQTSEGAESMPVWKTANGGPVASNTGVQAADDERVSRHDSDSD